jgi:hypothetical protein
MPAGPFGALHPLTTQMIRTILAFAALLQQLAPAHAHGRPVTATVYDGWYLYHPLIFTMFFDRFITAGFILGLSLGIAAFAHGVRTADATRTLVPQSVQSPPQPVSSGLGVGP